MPPHKVRALIVANYGEKCNLLLRVAAGAYLHGCAGDLAAEEKGQYSLMASDVLDKISFVIG